MADRLSPCVLSQRFALCSFSDYISVCVCVCSFECICTQLALSFTSIIWSFLCILYHKWWSLYCSPRSLMCVHQFMSAPKLASQHTSAGELMCASACVRATCAFACVFVLMWVNMCVLTNLGRLHCTHQDISVEKWQCQWSDSCVCVWGLMSPSLTAAILWSERRMEGWREEQWEEYCGPLILTG